MDIQNDTEIEIDFQVQGGPIDKDALRRPIRLGIGKAKRIDIGNEVVTVVFTSAQPQAGGEVRILDIVPNVRQDQAVHLVTRGVVVNEHGPLKVSGDDLPPTKSDED